MQQAFTELLLCGKNMIIFFKFFIGTPCTLRSWHTRQVPLKTLKTFIYDGTLICSRTIQRWQTICVYRFAIRGLQNGQVWNNKAFFLPLYREKLATLSKLKMHIFYHFSWLIPSWVEISSFTRPLVPIRPIICFHRNSQASPKDFFSSGLVCNIKATDGKIPLS